ncbi:hypothetical protein [Streptomyces luteireticuli]|uniref:Uncharacterized protein n=1 Tax=Streptomyces luteireticuli TaxID=173858 RepID=A0ABP3IKU9_9ACTN
MSRRRTATRTTLRIALASAAVAGAVLAPVSSAFAAPQTSSVAASADKSGPIRTYKLPDGSRAGVHEPKAGHFQVAVSKGDIMLALLDDKRPYATVHNLFVEMDPRNGRVTWVEQKNIGLGTDKGNRYTRGAYVGNRALADGIRAVVYRKASHEFTAYVVSNGKFVKLLDGAHPTVLTGKHGHGDYLVHLNARTGQVTALKDKGSNGQGPVTPVCFVEKKQDIGAGTLAVLTNSAKGPEVWLKDMGDRSVIVGHLDRKHPSLPKSAGIIAKITDINTAQPKLITKVEGGSARYATTLFPKLPKGCTVVNHVK